MSPAPDPATDGVTVETLAPLTDDTRRIVRGRWVVCGADDPTISDGAILVEGHRIADVGPWERIRAAHPSAEVLGSERFAVLPGLINAHHHANGATTVQHGIGDDLLELWLLSRLAQIASDPEVETLFGAARLLSSGVTSVVDMVSLHGEPDVALDDARRRLRAYAQSGIRVAFAPGVTTTSHFVPGPGEDERFLAGLPDDLRSRAAGTMPATSIDTRSYLELVATLDREWSEHRRLEVWYGPPGPQWVDEATLTDIADAAERADTGIQIHVAESLYEKMIGPRYLGGSVVAYLERVGILTPRLSLAHGVWLSDPEIEILARTGAAVSHNPSSNLRLRAGIGPLDAMLTAGVTVGLGLDANGLNDDDDILTELRVALRIHRRPTIDGSSPSVTGILRLATTGGARLLRRDHRLGRIAPGYEADLVMIELDGITWPWVAPDVDPVELILMRATRHDVHTVLIGGEVVLADHRPTRLSMEDVATRLAEDLSSKAPDLATRELVASIRPHLIAHYRAWGSPVLEPRTFYNSRT